MKQARIKELEALEYNLLADRYDVRVKIARNRLLISIPLKERNEKQVLTKWGSVRKAGG